MTLSIMTLSIMTPCITISKCSNEQNDIDMLAYFIVILSVVMPTIVIMNVIMLSVAAPMV
jgi:hypothetical protein